MNIEFSLNRSKEQTQDREAWRDRLREVLKQKVEFIKGLETLIEGTTLEEDPMAVENKLKRYFNEICVSNPDLHRQLQEYNHVIEETEQVSTAIDEIEYESSELSELYKKEKDLHDVRDQIYSRGGEDLRFLVSMQNGVERLVENFKLVKTIKNDRSKIVAAFNATSHSDILGTEEMGQEQIVNVAVTPFTITIEVQSNFFAQIRDDTVDLLGFHVGESPISIVKEGAFADTIRHEEIHAKLDGFLGPGWWSPSNTLNYLFPLPDSIRPPDFKKRAPERKNKFLSLSAPELINRLHNEMLADVDRVEVLNPKIRIPFSTAGNEITEIIQILNREVKTNRDPEIKTKCLQLIKGLKKEMGRITREMEQSLFVGNHTDKTFDVHALLTLLPPNKFHRVNQYLSRELGQTFKDLTAAYEVIRDGDFYLSTLESVAAVSDKLTARDLRGMRESFENRAKIGGLNFLETYVLETNIGDSTMPIKRLRTYLSNFERLTTSISAGEQISVELKDSMLWHFFFSRIETMVWKNPKGLRDFFIILSEEEKKIFGETVEVYFDEGFALDDAIEFKGDGFANKEEFHQFVRNSPLWELASQAGFLPFIESSLE